MPLKRIVTGLQPTGVLHIGNYFGVIKTILELQEEQKNTEIFVFIADSHSLTRPIGKGNEIGSNSLKSAELLLACGINPEKTVLFRQSEVGTSCHLAWKLARFVRPADLNGLHQYRIKSRRFLKAMTSTKNQRSFTQPTGQSPTFGLFYYPVLQAADILLYRATDVPIGEDQAQHLELTREIARRINRVLPLSGVAFFPLPNALFFSPGVSQARTADSGPLPEKAPDKEIPASSCRIKSLTNPSKKMSKSSEDVLSCLNLDDNEQLLRGKIRNAFCVAWRDSTSAGFDNLVEIYRLMGGEGGGTFDFRGRGKTRERVDDFEKAFLDSACSLIGPIARKAARLKEEKAFVKSALEKGRVRALEESNRTLEQLESLLG